MFGPVVGSVGGSRAPVVSKLALGIAAAKPMESRVHCFSAASLDVVGDDTMCCACDNIHSWISLSGDLAFSHQDGIYGFTFPKRFLEISSRDLTLFSILII